jgi:hypothetical protein
MLIREGERSPTRRGGATDAVNQDVESSQTLEGSLENLARPIARAQVGLNEPIGWAIDGDGPASGDDHRAPADEPVYDGLADPPGSARDEGPLPLELGLLMCLLHDMSPKKWSTLLRPLR